MQVSSVKSVLLSFVIASALPILACSDDNDTPTSPTQPGPPVSTPPPAPPTADPVPPAPPPPPPPTDDRPIVTLTGGISNLNRTGPDGLDVNFRIDDFTIVRASAGTPVISGGTTGDTSSIRSGQTLTVEGRRDNGFLDAIRITIVSP